MEKIKKIKKSITIVLVEIEIDNDNKPGKTKS